MNCKLCGHLNNVYRSDVFSPQISCPTTYTTKIGVNSAKKGGKIYFFHLLKNALTTVSDTGFG